jgi:YndJ-like protein
VSTAERVTVTGGFLAWLLLVVPRVGMRSAIVAIAVLVLVPLAMAAPGLPARRPVMPLVVLGSGLLVAASYLLPRGPLAGALCVPWAAVGLGTAAVHGRRWWARHDVDVLRVVALAWWPVGGAWLVASRASGRLLQFREPIVELTAAHFHVTGVVATTVVAMACRRDAPLSSRAAVIARAGIVSGPVIVAAGHLWTPALELVGTTVIIVALAALAVVVIGGVLARRPAPGIMTALVAASLAPFAPMVLALAYAAHEAVGTPAWSIAAMVRYHGAVNAGAMAVLLLALPHQRALGAREVSREAPLAVS